MYSGIYYISEDIITKKNYIKASFKHNALKKAVLQLDLVLKNTGKNKIELNDRHLENAKIFDENKKITLKQLIKNMEIMIKGKRTNLLITESKIAGKNKYFSIFHYGEYVRIPLYSLREIDGECEIEIKAPNIKLITWQTQFVIGTGETGSL